MQLYKLNELSPDTLTNAKGYLSLYEIIYYYSLPVNMRLLGHIGKEAVAKYREFYQQEPKQKVVTPSTGRNAGKQFYCYIYPEHFHKYILQITEQYAG